MNNAIMEKIQENRQLPEVKVGDTVKLHLKIKEAGKERTQIFEGIVLSKKGKGNNRTITVRKITFGIGVEKIVPLNTKTLEKLEIVKRGKKVRKSKLYYMRKKYGKKAMDVGITEMMEAQQEEVAEEKFKEGDEKTEEDSDNADIVEDSSTEKADEKSNEKVGDNDEAVAEDEADTTSDDNSSKE
jgi:large subunit ribosomal protein L19